MTKLTKWGLLCVGLLIATMSVGCTELDKAQFALHQEQANNIKTFAAVSTAYTDAADDMAAKKHSLQGQIISRVDSTWIKDHTGPDGKLTATPAELSTMLAQHDAATREMEASRSSWSRVSGAYRTATTSLLVLSETISAKDVDVQAAKKQAKDTAQAVLNVIISAGVGVGLGAL